MDVTYGQWERGLLPVMVDGQPAGFLSEDVDGWVFWKTVPGHPNRFELHNIAATRKQAVTGTPDI